MRKFRFDYRMELDFSLPAHHHRFSVKCLPASDEMQNVLDCDMKISPEVPLSYSMDSFGNRVLCGLIEQEHTKFEVKLDGTACLGLLPGHEVRPQTRALYRYPSAMTKPGEALFCMQEEAFSSLSMPADGAIEGEDALRLCGFYTQDLFRSMRYAPGETSTLTTAEEAAGAGCGVCQDYAHIMLALLRMSRIPCRYCAGLMAGEGASHAWVEAAIGDSWIGFDPTNGRRVDDTYLYISFGRDAKDCLMNRGVLTGGGVQTQTVHAVLKEIEGREGGEEIGGRAVESAEGNASGAEDGTGEERPRRSRGPVEVFRPLPEDQ